ncbi:Smr/MutS family protein [candidate division WOR-3 bacterium]|nr:Smr/MutS family protein [candidate division WOR-3 bacterium]
MDEDTQKAGPKVIPIDGTLDLHCFDPRETESLVREYLEQCRLKGIKEARIIHGKGKGILMKRVHSILDKIEFVRSYKRADDYASSWGATLVLLDLEDKLFS